MTRTWIGATTFAALVALVTAAAVLKPPPAAVVPGFRGVSVTQDAEGHDGGLEFRLAEGAESASPYERVTAAKAQVMDEAETRRVLERLPALQAERTDQTDFALREASLPAPRTGASVKETFPPPTSGPAQPETAAGPLSVLRKSPVGDVPLAPHVSLTFSQPMVAVSSQAETQKVQPATLEPQSPGHWRWVGAKTLLFESDGERMPMATEYRVTVPAGTRSANGGALEQPATWTFRTPPVILTQHAPEGGPARRDTLLFAGFDQRVDAQALLQSLEARGGRTTARLRLATPEEIEADAQVRALARAAQPGRFVVFKADAPLPADTEIEVTLKAGAPSAEGRRRTEKPQSWTFRTYGPMRVKASRCGWSDECRPFMPWQVEFTNPIDVKTFRKEMVHVEPALPGSKVVVSGSSLSIQGASRGHTTYRVTLAAEIPDVFGQTLGPADALSFNVGPAEPLLTWNAGDLIVLDPGGKPAVSVYSVNVPELRVEAWKVEPSDWRAHVEQKRQRPDQVTPPGKKVLTTTVKPKGQADELTETRIDLAEVFPGGLGHVILRVEPTVQPKDEWRRMRLSAWVQATRIGLTAFADGNELLGWASALSDGRPLTGVELAVEPGGPRATTGADGLAHLPLTDAVKGTALLVARQGQDVALLPESTYWWNNEAAWHRNKASDRVAWYVADDRGLYRPGEETRIKGWVRRIEAGPRGDVGLLHEGGRELRYTLRDSRGNEVTKGAASIDAVGGFDLALKLPPTMNLGRAALALECTATGFAQSSYTHMFDVQEFRRPEFEVKAQASEGPHVVGGHADITLTASYYAGGGLPGADVSWNVSARPTTYTPPNRTDFVFGTWVPWWTFHSPAETPIKNQELKGRTDASGRHVLRVDFDAANPPRATSLSAEGTVTDVNRQAWTATAALLVHPSTLYVGLKSERLFVQQGEPLVVQAIVTDIEGLAVSGRKLSVRAERLDWEQEGGEFREKVAATQDCPLTSAADARPCRFETREGGAYRVVARVSDDQGRANETRMQLWVAGGKLPPRRKVEKETIQLIPNKKEYAPGETAEILVLAPFAPAEALLTLRREGLARSERFTLAGGSHTLKILIEDSWTPNIHVQVDLNGAADRELPSPSGSGGEGRSATAGQAPKRPAFASGTLDISIPPIKRALKLDVAPRDKRLEPGGATTLDVALRDASGRPVAGGQVAIIVADEAVLALTRYSLPDPLVIFYPRRSPDVNDYYSRQHVVLARAEDLDLQAPQPQGEADLRMLSEGAAVPRPMAAPAGGALSRSKSAIGAVAFDAQSAEPAPEPIRMRTDFGALALFAAAVPTDAQGRAEVKVKLPDSLTRYRVMAVAVTGGKQFGSGESTIQARLPLMVRPSPPRFLNFGDRFELPVVLQNQTDAPLDVRVGIRATNAELTAGAGRRVIVPANDRVELRFPAAAVRAGTARFQVGGIAGRFTDAAEFKLPVWTPATTEAFATYGTLDQGAIVQPVQAPPDVVKQFGGLEVTTSSTAMQALTDAVLYLTAYPFECSEQLASRVLAVAALRDVLTAFKAEGLPKPDEMVAAVERDIARLRALQNDDGGFAFWRRGDESWPYLAVHVAHALERARAKGFKVPDDTWTRSQTYLRGIEGHIPSWYGVETRRTLIAYALYVRLRMGDADPARARKLIAEAGLQKLSFEAIGWLLPVLSPDKSSVAEVAAIRLHLANRVEETAGAAHFTVAYGDNAYLLLHSDRRADAVLLEALIGDQPQSDLIPKLVTGLMAHRKAGRWGNTQENTFVLLALDRYFGTYEKTTPDFVARLWLGERFAGEQAYRGRSTDRHQLEVPMAVLAQSAAAQPLTISKDGPGRLYYRVGMRYAPASLKLEPADYGFAVERTYESVDDKADVRRDADGSWHVKAGARVRVRLSLVASARRYHVALVDPLPAGLEALNPGLATTGTLPPDGGVTDVTVIGAPGAGGPGRPGMSWWWWTRPWFEHQNLRDERVEAFSSLLWEGVWGYSYVARATTLGSFVVPPAKAEEMYAPETFGRSGTDRVIVE
jgi:alpha-2-macroglobulin